MADLREVFPVLVDETSDEGRALTASVSGDPASAKVGLVAFAFKSSSGNVVLPTLTSEGRIPVDLQAAGTSYSASGSVNGSLTNVTVAEVTVANSRTYGNISCTGACFREAIFEVVHQDGTNNNIIGYFLVGPGQFSFTWDGGELEVTTGASGTQKILLRGRNLQKASDLRGNISCVEFAG